MTRAEDIVWQALRAGRLSGLKFKRQAPIGAYIADFVSFEARLIVELDGPPHDTVEQRQHDRRRDEWLKQQGFKVLRFPNELILGSAELALEEIRKAAAVHPSPAPR
jgi:very-short-patch-repair endonuclease